MSIEKPQPIGEGLLEGSYLLGNAYPTFQTSDALQLDPGEQAAVVCYTPPELLVEMPYQPVETRDQDVQDKVRDDLGDIYADGVITIGLFLPYHRGVDPDRTWRIPRELLARTMDDGSLDALLSSHDPSQIDSPSYVQAMRSKKRDTSGNTHDTIEMVIPGMRDGQPVLFSMFLHTGIVRQILTKSYNICPPAPQAQAGIAFCTQQFQNVLGVSGGVPRHWTTEQS